MKKNFTLLLFLCCFSFLQIEAQDVLYLDGSGATANLTIQSGASVYCQGGYVANASAQGMELDGNLYIGDASSGFTANWTDNMGSSSVLNTSTGLVVFQSNLQQNITGANTVFYKVQFNNSSPNASGLKMLSNLKVSNTATFTDGVVYANTYMFYVNNTSSSAIGWSFPNTSTYTNSWVVATYGSGRLDRDMTNSASTYDFPVGSSSAAQLLQVTPTTITGISRFACSWEASVTGASPLAISECGTSYTQVSNGAEWHLRPANGGTLGSGSFAAGDMTLRGWHLATFPGIIDNQFAILTRAEGNTTAAGWTVPTPSCTSLAAFNASGRTVASDNALRNNLSAFSDNTSQLGIGITIVILPIQLVNFTGWNEGDYNQLTWNTATEYNSDHFELERSPEGSVFEPLTNVKAAGFSSSELNYGFADTKPYRGLNYYRLKLVDRDNTSTYSNIVLIKIADDGSVNTVVYPNPTLGNINIQFQSPTDGNVVVQLTDELGRVLRTQNWNLTSGINYTTISTTGLPAAMYFIKIYQGTSNLVDTYKVVKEN